MTMVPDPEIELTSSSPQPTTPASTVNSDPKNAPPIKRRAPIACRRCRRMRSKCIHDKAPPCKSCIEANVPEECVFPTRGDSDQDRQFRHPRQRTDRKARSDAKVKNELPASPGLPRNALADYKPPKPDNEWEFLPGIDTVVDGINTFTRNYFQLGFIPKKMFPKLVKENPSSVNVFLLLSILAISARFNKTIIETYGDGLTAVTEFMHKAQCLAIHELYKQPTLERCQAFYVLSIAEQGSGKSNTSYISAGIAFRMAALMRLHREEAYSPITEQSPLAHRVRAESARRTFWMLHSQDNLHSGPYKPLSLAPGDITALLPSDEVEFDTGKIPERRAALDGTPPALQDPSLTTLQPRSLFASLMQVHNLWGIIARRLLFNRKYGRPNDCSSEYIKLNRKLLDFEQNLPNEHTFNKVTLSGYRNYAEDLAYLGMTGCLRLCHIVLRKEYMEDMIRHAQGNPSQPDVKFYKSMAQELFFNVRKLYSQIEAHYEAGVEVGRVGSQMAGFIIYGCGLLASYLYKFPQLDVHHAGQSINTIQTEGRNMYTHIVAILRECQKAWPLAETWCNGLEKWYQDPNPKKISFQAGTMTDGKEPQPYALTVMHPRTTTSYVQSEAVQLGRIRSTPPTPYADEREQLAVRGDPEPQRLAPLQQTQPGFAQTVYLPPLSQTPYHQQSASPQPPHPPQLQNYPQQVYPSSGLDMLAEASHHMPTPTPTTMDPYQHLPAAYYPEYPPATVLNDGFDSNLQMLVDGAGGQWPPADPAGLVYSTYDIPSYLPQP
ncbi:uncharacterized protein F4817DRAFT_216285 [Daldinia loculata]|uniref:uncharacterized protein n=1 Tax=Daldinia loculata TaxID=103429 RepID=UPI0020C5205B|nr:uncharacterized protein F4817DRAFT_216285 [Daldinia loculata]KAI1651018.1 hypothetical protein F4817DRAFT_216285 [Daldinia loculata]